MFSIKETLNSMIVFFIAVTLFMFIPTRDSFKRFASIFSNHVLVLSVIIAVLGIIKFILQLSGIEISKELSSYQSGTSLNRDYNFYILFSFLGIISLIFNRTKIGLIKFYLLLSILIINIVFSGSRRGLIILFILFALLFLFGTGFRFEIKKVLLRFVILITLLAVLLFSIIIYKNENSIIKQNQSVDLLKTSKAQNRITNVGFRYFTIFNNQKSIYDFYLYLWAGKRPTDNAGINKQYPRREGDNLLYNGNFEFGLKYWYPIADKVEHEIIKTPYGNGVLVKRYNGDNSGWPLQYQGRDVVFYSGHTYVISYKFKTIKGEGVPFKIGFDVDDPFLGRGKASNLYPFISDMENGWKQGKCSFTFWRSRSGIPLFMNCQEHDTEIEFADIKLQDINFIDSLPKYADEVSFVKNEVQNYLKRYDSIYYSKELNSENKTNLILNGDFTLGTLFWLPAASATEHTVIDTPFGKGIRVTRKDGDASYYSLLYNGRPIIYWAGHTYRLSFLFKVIKGSGVPFNVGWEAGDGFRGYPSYSLPKEITKLADGWNELVSYDKFKNTHYDLPAFLNSLSDNTEIEIAKVKLVDIDRKDTEPRYVDELPVEGMNITDIRGNSPVSANLPQSFYNPRTDRWKYAIDLYMNNYTFKQKILGGGFDYLEKFGKKFGEGKYDYPHNPFLDAFLFSGVFGGLIYIWYIIMVSFYYVKYYKKLGYFLSCFSIVLIFTLVSANTHFSVPVFAVLSIIPFLYKYLDESELLKVLNE